ncbi:MAG: hypothetical protein QOK40_453 [Miltoncostaeaceae bacterium]|nr:hypothetical protein [Miltoncostaeaceae bacterium]
MAEDPPVPEFDFPDRDEPAAAQRRAAPAAEPVPAEAAPAGAAAAEPETGFLSPRPVRRHAESVLVRVVATAGIVGISTAVAAVLGTQDVAYWLVGLVVSLLSVILAALLWRSRVL